MSNKALTWAFECQIKSGPKFVLVALADYADEKHSCYPYVSTLSKKTGIKEKTIGTHLKALEVAGYFTRERQRYQDGNLGSYRYTLSVDEIICIPDELAIVKSKPRGKSFKKTPDANLAGDSPDAKSGKTTCKIGQNHTLILQDNNPQQEPLLEPSNINACFEMLWGQINPKLMRSRRADKAKALKKFTALSKSVGLNDLSNAIYCYYADPNITKDNYAFASGIYRCLTGEKFLGYIGADIKTVMNEGGLSAKTFASRTGSSKPRGALAENSDRRRDAMRRNAERNA